VRTLVAAFAVLALACLLPTRASAQAAPPFSFAGTTWTSTAHDGGAVSTVQFNVDGTWTETWRGQRGTGHWQVNAAGNVVTVLRADSKVLKYQLKPDHQLQRNPGKIRYQLAAATTSVNRGPIPPRA